MEIIPTHTDHIEALGRVLAISFDQDPLFRYVFPDDERAERLTAFMTTQVRFGHLFGSTATTEGLDGAAVWNPPGVDVTPERAREAGFDFQDIFGREALLRFGELMDRLQPIFEEDVTGPHWFLNVVGVLPDRRRRGLGAALLRPAIARADSDALPCYLSTFEPENIPFYSTLGFVVARHGVDEPSRLPFWTMTREPGRN